MNVLVTGANGQLGSEIQKVSKDSANKYNKKRIWVLREIY